MIARLWRKCDQIQQKSFLAGSSAETFIKFVLWLGWLIISLVGCLIVTPVLNYYLNLSIAFNKARLGNFPINQNRNTRSHPSFWTVKWRIFSVQRWPLNDKTEKNSVCHVVCLWVICSSAVEHIPWFRVGHYSRDFYVLQAGDWARRKLTVTCDDWNSQGLIPWIIMTLSDERLPAVIDTAAFALTLVSSHSGHTHQSLLPL